MKSRSLGARLTLWYSLAFAVALTLLGGAMWMAMRQSLYHAIDEALRERMAGIIIFIQDHKDRLYLDEVKDEFRAHGDFFQVFDGDGQWVHTAPTLASMAAPSLDGLGPEPYFENLASPAGLLRFVSQTVDIDGHAYVVRAAAPLRDLEQGLRDALRILVPLFPVALLLASAAGYWVSRRALAPVDAITDMARSITAENLTQRLEVPPTGDELARLSATLNDMIARLESSFLRISQFTADASHELRTPLAVMRTTAEVALRAHEHDEHSAALEQIVAEVGRTSHLVENLLQLAKADSGAERLAKAPVDVVGLAREATTEVDVLARTKGIRLASELPSSAVNVHGDPRALRQLLLILLDNAVKYTPAGGRIEVSIAADNGHASVSVRDTGIGIPAEDLPHIFDRFYRVDRARSREHGGAGLGLAIGRWIAEAHGGAILVESELERGSVFNVRLPTVPHFSKPSIQ
jgi:heavy metal sensor kinase